MRKSHFVFIFYLVLMAIIPPAEAQEGTMKFLTGGRSLQPVLGYDENRFSFGFELDYIEVQGIGKEDFISLLIPGFYPDGMEGSPALPEISRLFESAEGEVNRIVIEELDSVIIDLGSRGIIQKVVPGLPDIRKSGPVAPPTIDSALYGTDAWIGNELIRVEFEGTLRGMPVSTLHVSPVRYNPARNQLKIYYHLIFSMLTSGPTGTRALAGSAFSDIYHRVTVRRETGTAKAFRTQDPMTLVILSDTLFRSTLQPFIEWKTRKGFRVVEAYRQDPEVGETVQDMKNYLHGLYQGGGEGDYPPEFLLIVGDVEQIPVSQSGGQVTDLYYATFDGEGDYIPDMFYGRISANSTGQLEGILEKILQYEQFQFPDPGFLDKSVLIAGVDGTYAGIYGNGQINYVHNLYLNESTGHQPNLFLYPGSDTSDQAIISLISQGVGFVNYTGHGLYNGWINPRFHQNDIDGLENHDAYPVVIGNGCQTNIFTLDECFAEALLRAPSKGALAYIGCTNDSYWKEDYFWAVGVGPILQDPLYDQSSAGYYDRVFHTHDEPYDLWSPTLGEMVFGGNMSVQESTSVRKKFYWEIYQLAGDPTLVPWFIQPNSREVNHPEMIPPGGQRLDLTCAPYDYAAISRNGILLDASHATSKGSVTLYLPDSLENGSLELVVSGDDFRPYRAEIPVGIPVGPYPQLDAYSLSHESVEEDGKITPGEEFSLDMEWINRGTEALTTDTFQLSSSQEELEVLDSIVVLGPLDQGDTLLLRNAFRIHLHGSLKDQDILTMGIIRKGAPSDPPFYLKETVAAPLLISSGIRWDDRPLGNGNGIVEKDELLSLEWSVKNTGHYRTGTIGIEPVVPFQPETGQFESKPQGPLNAGESTVLRFQASAHSDPSTFPVSLRFHTGDGNSGITDSILLFTGRHFEDFSFGAPGSYTMVNDSVSSWKGDTEIFRSSPRSLRSGTIGNYGKSEFSFRLHLDEPDSLSFSYRVSSESSYDFLRFYVDSVPAAGWSGESGWERYGLLLDTGIHEITWSYQKDLSLSKGMDAAWVDDILFPASAFTATDLSLLKILEPESGPWLTHSEEVRLLVKNTGTGSIGKFTVRLASSGNEPVEELINVMVEPGEETAIKLNSLLNLSDWNAHDLEVNLILDSDQYLGNNHLDKRVEHYLYPDLSLLLAGTETEDGISIDAIVDIANTGNVVLDTFRYEVRVDGNVTEMGQIWIGLQPGESTTDTLRILEGEGVVPSTGFHQFQILSIDLDSIPYNNLVEGEVFWKVLGLEKEDEDAELLIYPNPASGTLFLHSDRSTAETFPVELLDAGGNVLVEWMLPAGQKVYRLPVKGLSGGTYLLRIDRSLARPVVLTR